VGRGRAAVALNPDETQQLIIDESAAARQLRAGFPWLRFEDDLESEFRREQSDYEGSPTWPMCWERVVDKFRWLAEPFCDEALRADIIAAVDHLDEIPVADLAGLLGTVSSTARRPRSQPRF